MIELAVLDFETEPIVDGALPPKPVGAAIWLPGRHPEYLAWGHPSGNNISAARASERLQDLFLSHSLVMHNAAFDLAVARQHLGLTPELQFHDTQVLAFLDDPRAEDIGLKEYANTQFAAPPTEEETIHAWIKSHLPKKAGADPASRISEVPGHLAAPYAIGDVVRTRGLFDALFTRVDRLMGEAYAREISLISVLMNMRISGIRLDHARLEQATEHASAQAAELETELRRRMGVSARFNLRSKQVPDALETAGLANRKAWLRTEKSGERSTSAESMRAAVTDPEFLKLWEHHARLNKTITTWMKNWLGYGESG